jgi:hypothetical protein
MGGGFSKEKCNQALSASMIRLNMHRSKKLNKIAQHEDKICGHLKTANETNAMIWCESLINDER